MRIFFFLMQSILHSRVHILPELVLLELFLLFVLPTKTKPRQMNLRWFTINFIRRRVTYLPLRLLSTIFGTSFKQYIKEVRRLLHLVPNNWLVSQIHWRWNNKTNSCFSLQTLGWLLLRRNLDGSMRPQILISNSQTRVRVVLHVFTLRNISGFIILIVARTWSRRVR